MADHRQSSIEERLESWRNVMRDEGPQWLLDVAPRIIAELEAEIARLNTTPPSENTHDRG